MAKVLRLSELGCRVREGEEAVERRECTLHESLSKE